MYNVLILNFNKKKSIQTGCEQSPDKGKDMRGSEGAGMCLAGAESRRQFQGAWGGVGGAERDGAGGGHNGTKKWKKNQLTL